MPTKIDLTDAEKSSIAAFRKELATRQSLLQGFHDGGQFVIAAMIRARGLEGNWNLNAEGTELEKVE